MTNALGKLLKVCLKIRREYGWTYRLGILCFTFIVLIQSHKKLNCYSTLNSPILTCSLFLFVSFCSLWFVFGFTKPFACIMPFFFFINNKFDDVCDCDCDFACHKRRSSSIFNIFAIENILWSTVKTTEVEILVVRAKNQLMVLATGLQEVDARRTLIINHVLNYPLGSTIPCTHYILLFSFMKPEIILRKRRANVNFAKKIVGNTLISFLAVTSTFTSHALL